jgi:acetyl-CoA carboxylase carboxyl transferase subunit alpha
MSKTTFLNFEQPMAELDAKIEELRFVQDDSAVDISEEIDRLAKKSQQLTKDIYAKLTPWQVSQIARHPQRPYTMDYVNEIFTDFHELTATARTRTTCRSSAAWRASMARPA